MRGKLTINKGLLPIRSVMNTYSFYSGGSMGLFNRALDIDPRFADTVLFVEATMFEEQCLFMENERTYHFDWAQDTGFIMTIGTLADRRVGISFRWATINGLRVVFYEGANEIVDFAMIDDWFEMNDISRLSKEGYQQRCDAASFYRCLKTVSLCRSSIA